jgi:hypothetical protein
VNIQKPVISKRKPKGLRKLMKLSALLTLIINQYPETGRNKDYMNLSGKGQSHPR